MQILIATPLYPPDKTPSASYVKELATRLAAEHSVSVIAYGHLPEETREVTIIPIAKNLGTLYRLCRFGHTLSKEAKKADAVIIENGPATEAPTIILSLMTSFRYSFHITDTEAFIKGRQYSLRDIIRRLAARRAARLIISPGFGRQKALKHRVISSIPHPPERPEILPLEDYPQADMDNYEKAWTKHLKSLANLLAS